MGKHPFHSILRQFKQKAKQTEYVFLLSHMRGYTSLLGHILGSNPDIKGYSEMHQSYRSFLGLLKLRYKSKLTTKSLTTPRFLFDKLLHNKYKISGQILRQRNVYPLIMIREPEATIKSIINMGENMTKVVSWYKEPEKVVNYYEKRLLQLQKIGKRSRGKVLFIDGQQLIDEPQIVLNGISSFLRLKEPLQQEYDTFTLTGSYGAGDPSENIKKGEILKQRDKYESIIIDENLLQRAEKIYKETTSFLHKHSQTIT